MLADITIGDPYLIAVVPILITANVSLIAFLFRQVARTNEAMATVVATLAAQEHRIQRLEGFQDGVQFGRVTNGIE